MPLAMTEAPPRRDVVVVHSSDLHVDHDYTARLHGGDGTAGLASVLRAARNVGADVVLLAGDTFDCHRLPNDLLAQAATVIAGAGRPVVVLPGNHDPAVADAVYHHGVLAEVANLHVLGITHDEAIEFPMLGLEIWGRAHRDYGDMIPFETVRPRRTRWQIAAAHGHYVPVPDRSTGICRDGERGAARARRRRNGDAPRSRHCARAVGVNLTAPAMDVGRGSTDRAPSPVGVAHYNGEAPRP
jgi:predicted MPP superfamily phosphohydrolase